MVEESRLETILCGIALKNPVIPASGTFGFGSEAASMFDLDCLGGISIKGTTVLPRLGNPLPRIAEAPCGMLNSVGLQNPGLDKVIEEEIPHLRKIYHGVVIANVSGFSIDDYRKACHEIDPVADIIEVNVSCPNVKHGGMAFGTDPKAAAEVTAEVKKVTTKPVFIKLSPNVTDIVSIAKACEDAGADGLTLINTVLGMRIDIRSRRPVLANKTGGMSGPAIFPLAVRMVWQVANACRIPIMGCGGVSCAEDVVEMMMAGASAVQVGAATLRDPLACKKIVEALPATMDSLRICKLTDIIGIIH